MIPIRPIKPIRPMNIPTLLDKTMRQLKDAYMSREDYVNAINESTAKVYATRELANNDGKTNLIKVEIKWVV